MKRKLVILGLSLSTLFCSYGQQDQHFSLFTESPVYLNPATAGFAPGSLQLFTNYRLQWFTVSDNPFQTISASADWKMFDTGSSFVGGGINFYNDVAGAAGYQTNVINLPVNYSFQVSNDGFMSIGLQPAFYQRVVQNTGINWDSQWTGIEFDQTLSSNEVLLNQNFNVSRFDISAGFYWEGRVSDNGRLKLGAAGHHLTKQRINVTSEDARLYRKLTLHGQGEFKKPLTNFTFLPAFAAFLQGPNKEITFGSGYRFLLKGASRATSYFDEVSLTLGTYFRVGDAVVVSAGMDLAGFSFGGAYDLNVSRLNVATKGVGAMEFYIRYRFQFGNRNLRNNRVH